MMLPGEERIRDCAATYYAAIEKYNAARQEINLLKNNLYNLEFSARIQNLEDTLHVLEDSIKQHFSILSHAIATIPNKKHQEVMEDFLLYKMPKAKIAANVGYSYRHICSLISQFCYRHVSSFEGAQDDGTGF